MREGVLGKGEQEGVFLSHFKDFQRDEWLGPLRSPRGHCERSRVKAVTAENKGKQGSMAVCGGASAWFCPPQATFLGVPLAFRRPCLAQAQAGSPPSPLSPPRRSLRAPGSHSQSNNSKHTAAPTSGELPLGLA